MRTNVKVNSKTNGTLKMKNKNNMFSSLFAGVALMMIATVGMSFNTEDTTRSTDSSIKMIITTAASEDNGDLKKYTPANNTTLRADMFMDANFRSNELQNRKSAVSFTKLMNTNALTVEETMSREFELRVLVSAFTKELNVEIEAADATMDVKMNEEAEVRAKTSAYKTTLNNQVSAADNAMDIMMNVTTIKHIKPLIAADADKQMDTLMNGKNILPSSAIEADLKLDELINK
jgi:hypothetical protein